jgi:integrase
VATGLADTPDHRKELQPLAELVGKCIRASKDPLPIIAESIQAGSAEPVLCPAVGPTTGAYYADWIAQQAPPLVRKAQARDYRRHIGRYVLPLLGDLLLSELNPRDVRGAQLELLSRNLSVRYVKNILAGSFRAMVRQAIVDGIVTRDPFAGLKWPKPKTPEPDPFTREERTRILDWFACRQFSFHAGRARGGPRRRPHPGYHVFLHVLFWAGLRPSEAAGLQWQDIDLDRARLHVRRSRHLWEYGDPKTDSSRRTVELFPEAVHLLERLQPLHVTPDIPVFTNTCGQPVEPNSLLPHWYACQRALGIRVRGLYSTKDTYVTTALQAGVKIAWLEHQTGVSYATLRRHYGKWMPTDGESELRRFAALAPSLFGGADCARSTDPTDTISKKVSNFGAGEVRKGGLEPPRVFSPQDPEFVQTRRLSSVSRDLALAGVG